MNSNHILNLPQPATAAEPLRLQDLSTFTGGGTVTNIPAGGAANDILVKNSTTDYDVKWAHEATDLVGGTGITVSGTSPATIAITNTAVTPGTYGLASAIPSLTVNQQGQITGVTTNTIAASNLTNGTTGSGAVVLATSPTLTTPVIATITNGGTLTLPNSTDTLVAKNTTDTLTNKTFNTAASGNVFQINGTTITANTGTGSNVLATTPTLVTPVLGVATATSVTSPTVIGGTTASSSLTLQSTSGAGTTDKIIFLTGSQAQAAQFASSGGFSVGSSNDPGTGNALIKAALQVGVNGTATGVINFAGTTSGATTLTVAGTTSGTLTLPAATDTLIGKATTDTLTNKTFNTAATGNTFQINGTSITANTGTGSNVLASSPSITTPDIIGTATNNNSNVGSVGEILSSTILTGSGVSLTTATPANITSLSLTAGDWDVWGSANFDAASTTTYNQLNSAISTTTGSLTPAVAGTGEAQLMLTFTTGPSTQKISIPAARLSVAGTTTVFLVSQAVFAVSTMKGYGFITARRRR